MGTDLFIVGVLDVDRSKREFRVWVCRCYPDESLPETHSFFAAILYDMFESTGSHCNGMVDRSFYEMQGFLPQPMDEVRKYLGKEDDDENIYTAESLGLECTPPLDPTPFIEHVEMLRWCDSSPPSSSDEDEEAEYFTCHTLQAEYLVRVTDNKYLSCRADPSFLGHFFFSTSSYDEGGKKNKQIPMGPKQNDLIFPLEEFIFHQPQVEQYRNYGIQQLTGSVSQLLDVALPKLGAKDPTTVFTPEVFPRLPKDQQQRFLSILAFANRANKNNNDINPLHILLRGGKGIFFHIFSFLPLKDAVRLKGVKEVYLGLKYASTPPLSRPDQFYWNFDLLHCDENQVAMKHFSYSTIARKLNDICGEAENSIDSIDAPNFSTQNQQRRQEESAVVQRLQEEAAAAHLENCKRIVQVMESDNTLTRTEQTSMTERQNEYEPSAKSIEFSGLMDPRLFPIPRHPLLWIRDRVQAAAQFDDSIPQFVDHIRTVPPNIYGDG